MENALKPATNIIASVNPTGKDKHVMKKVSEINFDHGLLIISKKLSLYTGCLIVKWMILNGSEG